MDPTLMSYVKTADWKSEKHVPVISAPATAHAGDWVDVEVSVGKEIPHPNTVEHHIAWIALHFVPEGSPISFEIARLDLSAHGPKLATAPKAVFSIQVTESGTLYATEYCNIHGLWASSHKIAVS